MSGVPTVPKRSRTDCDGCLLSNRPRCPLSGALEGRVDIVLLSSASSSSSSGGEPGERPWRIIHSKCNNDNHTSYFPFDVYFYTFCTDFVSNDRKDGGGHTSVKSACARTSAVRNDIQKGTNGACRRCKRFCRATCIEFHGVSPQTLQLYNRGTTIHLHGRLGRLLFCSLSGPLGPLGLCLCLPPVVWIFERGIRVCVDW